MTGVLDALDAKRPWLIKEPRLCLLARELLHLLTRPVFVHVVRDPREVADSLAARDGLAREHALSLWETYTRAAFAATRGWPRVLVDYAQLIADPVGAATQLHASLARLGVQGLVMPDSAIIGAWIDPGLRRQQAAGTAIDELSVAQRELLAAINNRSILDRDFGGGAAAVRADSAAPAAASARAGG
jgi:hypothetical protein